MGVESVCIAIQVCSIVWVESVCLGVVIPSNTKEQGVRQGVRTPGWLTLDNGGVGKSAWGVG